MYKDLFNKKLYYLELDKLSKKVQNNNKLLNKYYINKEITLKWIFNNKNFIIKNIIKTLKQNNYQTPLAIQNEVFINKKKRFLYSFDWHERILHGALSNLLSSYFESFYSNSLNSYRKGRGSFLTLKDLVLYLIQNKNSNYYLIKTDISSYGDSINHEILEDTLKKYIKDKDVVNLIFKIIKFNYIENKTKIIKSKDIGLPTGSAINNIMTNIFLNELDKEVLNSTKGRYYRFGDDILFLSKEYNSFNIAKEIILTKTINKKLRINKEKFYEHSFEKSQNNIFLIKYLGFNIDFKNLTISLTEEKDNDIKEIISNYIKKIILISRTNKFTKEEILKYLISNFKKFILKSSFYSNLASLFTVVTDEGYWKKLDIYIAEQIVSNAYKIPKRKVFKKISYKELRAKGLISLLHLSRIYKKGKKKEYLN